MSIQQDINNLESQLSSIERRLVNVRGTGGDILHNDLGGLQGGQADQYYHLNAAEHGYISGVNAQSLLTTASPTFGKLTVDTGDGQAIIIKGTSTGDANRGWIGFYDSDGTTRRGWVGDASVTNDDIVLGADTGDLHLRSISGNVLIGTLIFADGSITDSGGAISFGNENLSTTGTIGCGDITLQDTITIGDGADAHLIKAVQEPGLGGRLTFGLDETAKTMVICDYDDVDVDFGLGAPSEPTLVIMSAAGGEPLSISRESFRALNIGLYTFYSGTRIWFQASTWDLSAGDLFKFYSAANIELIGDAGGQEQAWMYLEPKINQGGGANSYIGLLMDVTETSLGTGTNELMALRVAGADKFTIDNSGNTALADLNIGGMLNLSAAPESVTIAGGVITVTESYVEVDTQAADPTDDLDTINGGSEGDIIILKTVNSLRDVVVKNLTGNIITMGADRTLLSVYYRIVLQYNGAHWVMIAKNF